MAAEMAEQPAVLAGLLHRREDLVAGARAVLPERLNGIVLVARGSSDHAAVYGRYVLEAAAGRPPAMAAPSLHTLYQVPVDAEGYLAVGVSQSGETPEIVAVTERLRAAGAVTVAVTNAPSSSLAERADVAIDLQAGEEHAVPATKTFTAQLAAFAFLAEALGQAPWSPQDWEAIPEAVEAVLADGSPARRLAATIGDAPGLIAVGRGFLYAIALEAALKLKETASLLAEGYSAADLRHGPIAVVEREFPVLAFHVPGPAEPDMLDLVGVLEQRGARVFRVVPGDGADLPVPSGLAEPLAPIVAVVRAQQLSESLARVRGLDPDAPAGLTKVTPTK